MVYKKCDPVVQIGKGYGTFNPGTWVQFPTGSPYKEGKMVQRYKIKSEGEIVKDSNGNLILFEDYLEEIEKLKNENYEIIKMLNRYRYAGRFEKDMI